MPRQQTIKKNPTPKREEPKKVSEKEQPKKAVRKQVRRVVKKKEKVEDNG